MAAQNQAQGEVRLQQWSLSHQLKNSKNLILIVQRNDGDSIMKDIYQHLIVEENRQGIMFTDWAAWDEQLNKSPFVFHQFTFKQVEKFLEWRLNYVRKWRSETGELPRPSFCIIDIPIVPYISELDEEERRAVEQGEIILERDFFRHPTIRQLFLNARHYGIFFTLTMTPGVSMPPDLRINVEWLMMGPKTWHPRLEIPFLRDVSKQLPVSFREFFEQFHNEHDNEGEYLTLVIRIYPNHELYWYKTKFLPSK